MRHWKQNDSSIDQTAVSIYSFHGRHQFAIQAYILYVLIIRVSCCIVQNKHELDRDCRYLYNSDRSQRRLEMWATLSSSNTDTYVHLPSSRPCTHIHTHLRKKKIFENLCVVSDIQSMSERERSDIE